MRVMLAVSKLCCGGGAACVSLPGPSAVGGFASHYTGVAGDRAATSAYSALVRSLYYLPTGAVFFKRLDPFMSPKEFVERSRDQTFYASASCVMYTAWDSQIHTTDKKSASDSGVFGTTPLAAGEVVHVRGLPNASATLAPYVDEDDHADRTKRLEDMSRGVIKVRVDGADCAMPLDAVLVPHVRLLHGSTKGYHVCAARAFPKYSPITIFAPSDVWNTLPVEGYSIADYTNRGTPYLSGPRVSNSSPAQVLCAAHFANEPDGLDAHHTNQQHGSTLHSRTTGWEASGGVWFNKHFVASDIKSSAASQRYTTMCYYVSSKVALRVGDEVTIDYGQHYGSAPKSKLDMEGVTITKLANFFKEGTRDAVTAFAATKINHTVTPSDLASADACKLPFFSSHAYDRWNKVDNIRAGVLKIQPTWHYYAQRSEHKLSSALFNDLPGRATVCAIFFVVEINQKNAGVSKFDAIMVGTNTALPVTSAAKYVCFRILEATGASARK